MDISIESQRLVFSSKDVEPFILAKCLFWIDLFMSGPVGSMRIYEHQITDIDPKYG